jgi:hypothetical protein
MTLIELMISIAVLFVVIGVGAAFWTHIQNNYQFITNQNAIIDSANQSIRQMVNEVRQAREAMNGAYPLAILEDYQLAYYADIRGNGEVVRIRYYLDGETLLRGTVRPTGNPPDYDLLTETAVVIADSVATDQGPLFYYYDGNWPGDTENNPLSFWQRPLETRLIEVVLPLRYKTQETNQLFKVRAVVSLRNLKNNL